MGYTVELSAGQSVYLENLGAQTQVTTSSSSPGQQQQSSSSLPTGMWTAAPEAFRVAMGVVIKLYTAQGNRFLHIQGDRLSTLNDAPSLAEAQPIQVQAAPIPVASMPAMTPMQPLSPMPPMTMGEMHMEHGGMSMQMGRMRMSMHPIAQAQGARLTSAESSPTNPNDAAETPSEQRRFCSQCGVPVKPSDQFCASCGHRLS